MMPEGLKCKNTFFDLDEEEPEERAGPATAPPSSEGWWWPTSSMGSDGSRDRSLPSSPTTPLDIPKIADKTTIIKTPSWFGDTPPPTQTNFISTPSWFDDLVPPPSNQIPLSTPDWLEGDIMPAYAALRSFETQRFPKRAASTSSGDSRTPMGTEGSSAPRRTPDPFEDTPSPPMDMSMSFSNSSSRFVQMLAGAVAADEAPEKIEKPETSERQPPIQPPQPLGSLDANPGNWARPLIKPPMLLATAAPHNEPPGPYPPFGSAPLGPPPMPVPLPPMPCAGSLLGDRPDKFAVAPGTGFRSYPPFDDVFGDRLAARTADTSESPQRPRKTNVGKGGSPKEAKSPLPAGPLLPGQVAASTSPKALRAAGADGEEVSPNRRRKRGSRESKEPDISEEDPHGLLPTAAFVDLGVLLRAA